TTFETRICPDLSAPCHAGLPGMAPLKQVFLLRGEFGLGRGSLGGLLAAGRQYVAIAAILLDQLVALACSHHSVRRTLVPSQVVAEVRQRCTGLTKHRG